MRLSVAVMLFVLGASSAAWGQGRVVFDDVPPWHWAFAGVQEAASAGIFVGYPTSDRELVENAVTQVYDAFVHATNPEARTWAERFLMNTPADWPQPLLRSRMASFSLEDVRIAISGDRGTVSLVAAVALQAAGGIARVRAPMRIEIQRDAGGRWRLDYASLAAGQPQVFR